MKTSFHGRFIAQNFNWLLSKSKIYHCTLTIFFFSLNGDILPVNSNYTNFKVICLFNKY